MSPSVRTAPPERLRRHRRPLPILNEQSGHARRALLDVASRPWFSTAFHNIVPGRVPFDEPRFGMLVKLGIIDDTGRVLFRINVIADKPFVTDGLWAQHRLSALYPFEDEAAILLKYASKMAASREVDAVVDLASGCGHTVIAHPCPHKFALEVNRRAQKFVELNAALNNVDVRFRRNDIRDGLPTSLINWLADSNHVLFFANMPFAVSPRDRSLPLTTDGGQSGNDLTLPAIQSLCAFEGTGTALLLTNSLYNSREQRWQITEEVGRRFPTITARWHLAREVRVWRVNGRRSEANPMNIIDGLPRKADCEVNVGDAERVRTRRAYERLAVRFARQGWDKLGCGILCITLAR